MNGRVLLICYYFPPMGLAGVGRPLNLFKQLPRLGWACDVLTVKPVTYWAYEPELLEGLNKERIFRSGSSDPQRIMHLLGLRHLKTSARAATSKVAERFFPDSKRGWVRPAVRLGRTLIENYRHDVILSTSPPISSHLVGRQLAKDFSLPWVADFRDFWTSWTVEQTYDKPRLVKKGNRLLETIRTETAAVTGVNDKIIDYLGGGDVIPNGFDSDRMVGWNSPPDPDRYAIGVLGNLHDTRVIDPLAEVLGRVRETAPELFDRAGLIQVGSVDPEWLRAELAEHKLADRCEIHGYQPREKTVVLLSKTSLLYIGMSDELDPVIVPSRTFDLLASGRPILAYAPPDSGLARLIAETGNGFCFYKDTVDAAAEYVRGQLSAHAEGRLEPHALPEYSRPYSAETLAERFASVLEKVV